jgi:hypothetical protein
MPPPPPSPGAGAVALAASAPHAATLGAPALVVRDNLLTLYAAAQDGFASP